MCESRGWKKALTKIIVELSEQQYKDMLRYLKKIPKSVKHKTPREHMAQTILEHYGEKESIAEIRRIMDEIPRNNSPIQNLLRPFVEKPRKKRKPGPESEEQQESPSELKKKKKKTESDDDDDDVKTDDPGSSQSEKVTKKGLERQWRLNLSSILDELTEDDFERLLLHLDKIPGKMKDIKFRTKMPEFIIQRYGLDKSIKAISNAMADIPRNDCKIQDLIQPILKKLEALNQQHTKNKRRSAGAAGGKNVQSPGRPLKRKRQPNPQPEMDSGTSMKAKRKKTKQKDSSLIGSSAALRKTSTPGLTKTIRDLKAGGGLGQKVLTVKVVHKSDLCQNQTRTKFYFHLGVADETDAIKVVVFGSERFPDIKKDHFYTIRDALMNHKEKVLKITERTKMSETGPFEVPRNVELEAEKLIFSPVCSIRDIQSLGDKKEVSVKGTVKEIGVIKSMEMKAKPEKRDKQAFELEDGTGSITVDLWGEDTKHLRGISNGDVVLVNNLKTNLFKGRVSLNSTNSTRITKSKVLWSRV